MPVINTAFFKIYIFYYNLTYIFKKLIIIFTLFNQNSITVIITTYNSSTYFEKAIESVLNQSIKVETIIIVDDCSEDFKNLKEKLSKIVFNNKNTNFELIHNKKNRGPGYSRNAGWNRVKTKFIAFLDSDDIWKINKLEEQLKIFNNYNNLSLVATAKEKIKYFKTGFVNINTMLFRNLSAFEQCSNEV